MVKTQLACGLKRTSLAGLPPRAELWPSSVTRLSPENSCRTVLTVGLLRPVAQLMSLRESRSPERSRRHLYTSPRLCSRTRSIWGIALFILSAHHFHHGFYKLLCKASMTYIGTHSGAAGASRPVLLSTQPCICGGLPRVPAVP